MLFNIYKYKVQNNPFSFSPQNVMMTAWMCEKEWDGFLADFPEYKDGELYVKITSNKPCGEFVTYRKLSKLPSRSIYTDVGDDLIWMDKETMPFRDMTDNRKDVVDVSIIDINDFPIAKTITIKLQENDVERWSEEDFQKAISNIKSSNRIAHLSQRVFFFPDTKKSVVAEIVEINGKHTNDGYDEKPFVISNETEIKLEGKPVNPQKAIDFSQIGGQNAAIKELREIIQLPMNFPEYFEKFGVTPPKGILLYGPPGNGKTMIARALADTLGASFINIDLSDALQKYKGVGEHNLDKKFDEAENKRNAVIFIDEIDAIASIRSEDSAGHEVSLVGKLLSLMDGIKANHRVFVIGATNRINAVDPALRRPGRFDKELEVPLPDSNGRRDILLKYVRMDRIGVYDETINDAYITQLSAEIEGYSGADISALYREATMAAIREQLEFDAKTGKATIKKRAEEILVSRHHFEEAKERVVATSKRSDVNK